MKENERSKTKEEDHRKKTFQIKTLLIKPC